MLGTDKVIRRPYSFESYLLFRKEMLDLALGEDGASDSALPPMAGS